MEHATPRDALAASIRRARGLRRHTQGFAAVCEIIRHSEHDCLHRALVMRNNGDARPTTVAELLATSPMPSMATPRLRLLSWITRVKFRPVKSETQATKPPKMLDQKFA